MSSTWKITKKKEIVKWTKGCLSINGVQKPRQQHLKE